MPSFQKMPKSLKDLMTTLSRELITRGINPVIAANATAKAVEEWQQHNAGFYFYVPNLKVLVFQDQKQKILAAYKINPDEVESICQNYNITRRTLYKIEAEERDRQRGARDRMKAESRITS